MENKNNICTKMHLYSIWLRARERSRSWMTNDTQQASDDYSSIYLTIVMTATNIHSYLFINLRSINMYV